MRIIRIFIIIAILFSGRSYLMAGEPKQVNTDQSLPAGVSIYQLDNGLQVLLIENPILPMTGVNVVVKTGSAYENFATSGMNHMLEHLLFNGTTSRTQKQLYDEGDQIGGYNNASTSHYYADYMMVTPAGNIKKGMEIQADMLFNSILPTDKFEKEKGIVLEEIAKDLNDPKTMLNNNIHYILFRNHSLSLPVPGTYSTIESMSRDDVYAYYKNTYLPNNMILTAIGPFESDSMLAMIREIYGAAKPGNVEYPRYSNWKSGLDLPFEIEEGTRTFHRFYNGEELQIQMFYQLPLDFSGIHFTLIDEIFKKNHDALLTDLQKEFPAEIKSLEIETVNYPVKNYLWITVQVPNEFKSSDIQRYINKKIGSLELDLPPETIQFLATKARTDYLLNLEKPHMFGIYNAETLVLDGMEAVLQEAEFSAFTKAIQQTGSYKINPVPVVIIQHPEIKAQVRPVEISTQQQVFTDPASGMILIAKQNVNSNLLAVHYLFKHKANYESQFGKNAAQILHDCFGQRLNSTGNQRISNRYGLSFKVNDDPTIPMDDIYLHPDFGYIRVEGLADDLPGVITYLSGQMNKFVPTREEFSRALENSKRLSGGGMGGSKVSELFTRSYGEVVYESNPFPPGKGEIGYEEILKFKDLYFTPDNRIISAVSPAIPDSLHNLFVKNIPVRKQSEKKQDLAYVRALKIQTTEVTNELKGGGEQSFLFWGFTTGIASEDQAALEVFSQILADRIIFNVREKQGRAYRMSAGIEVVKDKALFYVRLGTRPENVDALLPQIPQFFDNSMVNTITAEELQKVINMYLGRMMFRRLSSINQAYYLAHSLYFFDDCGRDQKFLNLMKQVALDDVKRVAQKYMSVRNPVTVIVR